MTKETMGYYCLIAGVSMLAGWWVAFRNRPYLAFLGGCFVALASTLMIGGRLETGPPTPALKWGLLASIGAAGVLFVAAFVSAIQESRRRFQEMRAHYHAAAEAMVEMARAKEELARRAREQAPDEPDDTDTK